MTLVPNELHNHVQRMNYLISVIQKLSLAKDLPAIVEIVRHAARKLTGADGATFILKDGERCYYVDEDAISPLWKGGRFPLESCISGWAMLHRESVVIPDIFQDSRVPVDLYEPTFVRSLAMVPIRSENPIGAIGNYWATYHKITDEELYLLELLANSTSIAMENIQLYTDLERQLHLRDEFLSMAAHEMKTPITSLALRVQQIQRLLMTGADPAMDKIKKHSEICGRQVDDIIRMMENFLDVSRVQLGKFLMKKEPRVSLNEIIRGLVERYQTTHNVDMKCHFEIEASGEWDPVRLRQLFRNLFSNAIRYGGGKLIEIFIRQLNHSKVLVGVRDHGVGIPKKDQERIFNRFERGDQSVNYGGIGLGLYISRQIVNTHKGKLWVESEEGKGATFWVSLPQ